MGAPATQAGLSPTVEPVPVSPADAASIPSALGLWKMRANIRHHLMTGLIYRSTGKDPKNDGYSFAEIPDWQLRQWVEAIEEAASAIEARRAETGTGSVHESAMPQADAQVPQPAADLQPSQVDSHNHGPDNTSSRTDTVGGRIQS